MAAASDRSSGVLLHVSSLPGPYGIGDLGPEARRWIDWLAGSGTRFWQVLPLGPPGAGNSPYSSYYSHAGSPDLISPDDLVGEGLLSRDEVKPLDAGPTVSYDRARAEKMRRLEQALGGLRGEARKEFNEFRDENRD
ncbi:MAG TPA: 4-alpha-glucanotransferase, partial [Acidimicrobiia bacterium]